MPKNYFSSSSNAPAHRRVNAEIAVAASRQTILVETSCPSVQDCYQYFGHSGTSNLNSDTVVVTAKPSNPNSGLFLVVPEACYAVIEVGGGYKGVYEPGIHLTLNPLEGVSRMITHQTIVFDCPVRNCPTQDNVFIGMDVQIQFHIEADQSKKGKERYLPIENFAYKLSPANLGQRIQSLMDEHLRMLAQVVPAAKAYDLRTAAGEPITKMLASMNAALSPYGVVFEDCAVTNITLPHELVMNMQTRSLYVVQNAFNEKKQTFQLQEENNVNHQHRLQQEVSQARQKKVDEYKNILAEIQKEIQIIEADTSKLLAEISEAENSEVLRIKSEGQIEIARLGQEANMLLSQGLAEIRASAAELTNAAAATKTKKLAEAGFIADQQAAKGIKVAAAAEERAKQSMINARKQEVALARVGVLTALASNVNVAISGDNADDYLAAFAAASNAAPAMMRA
jgi:hypothetical protein